MVKLSRRRHLHRFGPRDFDYLVLDEFHHAAARSYRRPITVWWRIEEPVPEGLSPELRVG